MGEYTSPFFGDRDMMGYTPPSMDVTEFFEYRNRADVVETNDIGQVYTADIFINTTQHWNPTKNGITMQDYAVQYTVEGQSDRPCCIFAMPSTYGNTRFTQRESQGETYAGLNAYLHDMPTYQYFLVSKNKGASITQRYDNIYSSSGAQTRYTTRAYVQRAAYTSDTGLTTEPPAISEYSDTSKLKEFSTSQRMSSVPWAFKTAFPNEFVTQNSDTLYGSKWYSYTKDFGTVETADMVKLATLIGVWAARTDTVIDDITYISLMGHTQYAQGRAAYTTGDPAYYNYIGTYIATGFPVFTLDSFDQMVRYFQNESWIADNEELPPSDWSTDWDIYVKGAQKPDIFITMKSDKLDEWLEDLDENKSGLIKSDITVEYRYKIYGSVGDNDIDSDKYFPWGEDVYNETGYTSYMENVQLNYGNADITHGGGEFSDYTIEQLMGKYARMEFRLHYGKYKSTWCRYKIGVIGSPSVPDFVKMQNEGVQDDDFQDDSTVTLHYDEYPDGYDPYPTPPVPPVPPPKPTYPSPSQNGLGLLTTTYKITPANAKALGRFLWGSSSWLNELKALNFSPIENIVGLKIMPIDIDGTSQVIYIGNVDTNINGDRITSIPLYKVGELQIEGRYKSFLDYAPNTSMLLFLPFVGFVSLDPQFVTGKKLEIIYSFDLLAGVCNAMIFCNGVYVESHQGNCGIDIPLVASNRAEMEIGLATSLASTAASIAAAPATGGMSSVVGLHAFNNAVNDLSSYATGFHTQRQGGYSPTCAWTETRECFIVIETPNAAYSSTYAHDYGRPCMATYSISQLNGFTVCEQTVDVSGISGATEEEKRRIREILTSGFYA